MALGLPIHSGGSRSVHARFSPASPARPSAKFKPIVLQGAALVQKGDLLEATAIFETGLQSASEAGDRAAALRFLNNIATCRYLTFDYQGAMRAYQEGRRAALELDDHEAAALIAANIASLFSTMGDFEQGVRIASEAAALPWIQKTAYLPRVLMIQGDALASLGRFAESRVALERAVAAADALADRQSVALAWDRLADNHLAQGDAQLSETFAQEAFRIRVLDKSKDVQLSYPRLGRAFLAQRRYREALRMFDLAVGTLGNGSIFPWYEIHHNRALVRQALGDWDGAMADLRVALEFARRFRQSVLPVSSLQARSESTLAQVRSEFIRQGYVVYAKHPRESLALELLKAAEESRHASLRARFYTADGWQRRLPPAYWQAVHRLQQVEWQLSGGTPNTAALRNRAAELRGTLLEIEALAGLEMSLVTGPAGERGLFLPPSDRDNTLLSFHLDHEQSYGWEVTAGRVRMFSLPGRERLTAQIAAFHEALAASDDRQKRLGHQLYSGLFGRVSAAALTAGTWTIVPDESLFGLPFAALPVGDGFLVERQLIRLVPSAYSSAQRNTAREDRSGGPFVGVSDPIYNRADRRAHSSFRLAGLAPSSLELPRLAGGREEVERCASRWRQHSGPNSAIVLTGNLASKENLRRTFVLNPAVIHLATHVVPGPVPGSDPFIALRLAAPGSMEILNSVEIAAQRVDVGLVVLSGCHSGAGQTISGAGLMGLTRAWTLAGARAVVASHWPTPDDTGELFDNFYSHYGRFRAQQASRPDTLAAARALQQAQREMIQATGWRSHPRYWAAFFIVSRG